MQIITFLHRKLTVSEYKDADMQNRQIVLNWLLLGLFFLTVVAFFSSLITLIFLKQHYVITRFIWIIFSLFVLGLLFYLSKRRRVHIIISSFLVFLLFSAAGFVLYTWGILTPTGVLLLSLAIVMAGILISARYSLYLIIGAVLVLAGLEFGKAYGFIKPDNSWMNNPSNPSDVIVFSSIYAILGISSWLFNRQTELSLQRARRSEGALIRQKALLEVKVKERTRELEKAQMEKLQEVYRFAELGHLSTALFHDLANSIMSVSVDIEGLKKRGRSDILQRIHGNVHYIEEVVQHVHKHIQGKRSISTFNISTEIEEVVSILSQSAKKAGVVIDVQTGDSKKPLLQRGDRTRFRQLVTNLLSNAIEAYTGSPKRRGKKRIVRLTVTKTEDTVVISVTDFGKGISRRVQSRIFDPFYSTKDKGIGIGLFIAKKVTEEDLKGTITVSSNQKEGTTFRVTLPINRRVKHTRS